jgi:hypothetical protein
MRGNLLFFLLVATLLPLCGSCSTLALNTAGASAPVWRCKSEVNVLLGVETDDKRWDVDDLFANTAQCSE